jgi:hypothetical protein
MFCSKCGKQLREGSVFCDGCGVKIESDVIPEILEPGKNVKEGKIYKCPHCGEVLTYDALICPTCKNEIRGRKTASSVQEFSERISLENNQEKVIGLIKTFPIPNNREDIFEFMLLASSNFDAKYYSTNKVSDSLASAWLSKIDQCYNKGKIMFTNKSDLYAIDKIYNEVHHKIKSANKTKMIMIFSGIALIVVSTILILEFGENSSGLGFVFMAMLAIGIVVLVKGLKKNKTNKELAEEKLVKQNANMIDKGINPNDTNNQRTLTYTQSTQQSSGKVVNKNVYVILTIFLGMFGAHKFYAGKTGMGFIYLFTFGLFYIGWFIDIFAGARKIADSNGNIVL